jgi:HK97 family phage prohead protease
MLNREYGHSIVELKSVDDERRIIRGMASTPDIDRMGDIVDPLGARAADDIPLFLYHDSNQTVGRARLGKATKAGIPFEATMPHVKEAGRLQDRVDEAWQMLKYKLITGVSIGFRPMENGVERMKDGGLRFKDFEILELSLVPVPANAKATVDVVRSLDTAARAASGHQRSVATSPGASGTATTGQSTNRSPKGTQMKTLKDLREERTLKAARLQELGDLMKDATPSDEELSEFDELERDIKSIDSEIRTARVAAVQASGATPVSGKSASDASRTRGGEIIVRNADPEDSFAGQSFARIVKAKAVAWKQHQPLSSVAENMYGKTAPGLVRYMKSGVPGGGTGSGEWGAELVGIDNRYMGDFIDFLYGLTAYDKLGLRAAPRNVAVKGMDGAATANWVGESKSIPVSAPSASTADLTANKLAGLCVMSNELLADSSPGAELLLRDALAEAIALKLDTTFFSAVAASAGVSPAGILNGLSQIAMGSQDAAGLRAFINAAYAGFITAKNSTGLKLVMSPGTAKAVGLLVNALGQSEFPGLGTSGGTLLGDTVVVGDNIDPSQIILLKPSDIWSIGDTGVDIAMSNSAMVEQDSAPQGASDTPVAASATMMSMFGTDSTAIRAIRRVGWKLRRTGVVAFTDTADFGGVSS